MSPNVSSEQGELRLVPVNPSDDLVREILYNINRKRRNEDELTADDVREVVHNLHWNGRFSPKAGAAQPRGMDFLRDLVMELSSEAPGDLKAQARDILRREVWYEMTDLEIEHGCSVHAREAVAAIVAALRIAHFSNPEAAPQDQAPKPEQAA